ncbi:MAG: hypothetical protein ACLFS8_06150, partial [Clostridia bacterium]
MSRIAGNKMMLLGALLVAVALVIVGCGESTSPANGDGEAVAGGDLIVAAMAGQANRLGDLLA